MNAKQIDPKYHIELQYAAERVVNSTIGDSIVPAARVTIVKTSNREAIPDDEPVILFRGRDRLTLPMLRYYRQLCEMDGCVPEHIAAIDHLIAKFEGFTVVHPERMKQPGVTRGL